MKRRVLDSLAAGVSRLEGFLESLSSMGVGKPTGKDPREARSTCIGDGWRLRLAITCHEGRPGIPGPLHGVPVAYKDNMEYPGEEVRLGSPVVFTRSAGIAEPLARLAGLGAYPAARASMDEYSLSVTGYNEFLGTAANPVVPGRIIGGSTSGGAGLVALWKAGVALATDAGGSARIPAAYTGLYGFKLRSSQGSWRGVYRLIPSLEALGVIAWDPATLALSLEAIQPGLLARALSTVRLWEEGMPRPTLLIPAWVGDVADSEVLEAFEAAVEDLEDAGFLVVRPQAVILREAEPARAIVTLVEALDSLSSVPREAMPQGLRELLNLAAGIPGSLYAKALKSLEGLRGALHATLQGVVIATPAVPVDAPSLEEAERLAYSRKLIAFTGLANALDMASAVVPARSHRLPSGIPLPLMFTSPSPSQTLAITLTASSYIHH